MLATTSCFRAGFRRNRQLLGTGIEEFRRYLVGTPHFENGNSFKVAIVGSGPSGCYTAKYFNAAMQHQGRAADIDILERLPTAFGLVRNGVAPDHPEVKNVQNDFSDVLESNDNIKFYGNVHVGRDVTIQELRSLYDIVVLAYGCASDRSLQLPGSNLEGVLSAREFVNWYNGHPDFHWVGPKVKDALTAQECTGAVVVIGHGNVALDCARILAKTREELDPTDITTPSLDVLHPLHHETGTKRSIVVIGRRGHIQAAFTIKEVRELTKLSTCKFVVSADELEKGMESDVSRAELEGSRPKTRIYKLLAKQAASNPSQGETSLSTVVLRFLLKPIRLENNNGNNRVARVIFERTKLEGEVGKQQAIGTGEEVTFDADLVLTSIGYKGVAMEGVEKFFDENTGIVRNTHGIVDAAHGEIGGLFVAGWLKRGPTGIIGTNIADAKDTVSSILQQIDEGAIRSSARPLGSQSNIEELLSKRGVDFIEWEGYKRIEAAESSPSRKRNPHQPREKVIVWAELLDIAREATPSSI